MISRFNNLIILNKSFHLIFQELLQENINHTYVNPLFFLLQFLTHSINHNFFNFSFPLLFPSLVLMSFIQNLIKRVYFRRPFSLFIRNRLLYRLQHIPASIAESCLIKLIIFQRLQFHIVLI